MSKQFQQSTQSSSGSDKVVDNPSLQGSNSLAQDEITRETYLRMAQDIVTESNAEGAKDQPWHEFNGGNTGVEMDGTTKPEAWYRGLALKESGDQEEGSLQDYNTYGVSGGKAGIKDAQKFRDMLKSDLSFNKAFDNFETSDQFVEALMDKYCKDMPSAAPRREEVRQIGYNLWSYQLTGADVTGKTNIKELQGMLFSLDAMIAEASQSNTKHEGSFTIPGSDIELHTKGDGVHGRASILETRMLASLVKQLPPEKIPDPDPETRAQSYLIIDNSSSMYADLQHIAATMKSVDYGTTELATMTNWTSDLKWATQKPTGSAEVVALLEELSRVYTGEKRDAQKAGAKMSRVNDAFGYTGAANESSIHHALELLRDDEKFQGPDVEKPMDQQIVVATDEKDCRPDQLKELKELADKKDVDVILLYMRTSGQYEISIRDIADETLAMLDDTSRRGVKQAIREGLLREGVPYDEMVSEAQNGLTRLDWEAIAGLQGVERTPYD